MSVSRTLKLFLPTKNREMMGFILWGYLIIRAQATFQSPMQRHAARGLTTA